MAPTFASALTLSAVALGCRAFTRLGTKRFDVQGLPILLDALKEPASRKGKERERIVLGENGEEIRRGIVTDVVNDASVHYPALRIATAPSDIMFTNPYFSRFFTLGQVIETYRGGGIFQPAVDEAVRLLQSGEWIHIFPEGKINQPTINPDGGLFRFKWGVGRIIMDSSIMPEIIPIWISALILFRLWLLSTHTNSRVLCTFRISTLAAPTRVTVPSDPAGFDQIMDERRGYPRPIPRPGASVSITVGSPLTPRISPLVDSWRAATKQLGRPPGEAGAAGAVGASGCIGEVGSGNGDWAARANGEHPGGKEAEESMRIKICEILQEGVRELGESVERKEGRMERGEWCHSSRRGGGMRVW
ncbi:hypothetical protein EHS25_009352 [Saitozyma podzolica]|uniref:Tafazzin family protein n=1 Tax=Saitozyma podzolica TaxID=1890683 RepID=A0A427YLQ3_9TREE|nr:hypothetical protein EHS25_009352 [Saitozyma podzolica]